MKLTLVVLTAGQQGKVLNIALPQFLIGRDPQCHLRPASALISKRHCALIQREGKAFIRDFDSTNGTLVNDQPVKGEVELHHDDQLKVGPLVFTVKLEAGTPAADRATPPPPTKAPAAKAPVAKAPAGAVKAPAAAKAPAVAAAGAKPAGEAAAPPSKAVTPAPAAAKGEGGSAEDDIAAMLLSLQDDTDPNASALTGEVPEGSTVHDLTVPQGVGDGAKPDKEKDKKAPTGNTSTAAKSILEKYMRRPRPTQ